MNKLSIVPVLSILNRCNLDVYNKIAITAEITKASGWMRAVNNCTLFRKKYMGLQFMIDNDTELRLWKKIFPNYPRLHLSYELNLRAFITIIHPEMYIQQTLERIRIDQKPDEDYEIDNILSRMTAFETPYIRYGDLQLFFQRLRDINADLPRFLECVIDLHGWPGCFNDFAEGNFWQLVSSHLHNYEPEDLQYIQKFLSKHMHNFNWRKNSEHLYKFIDGDFIANNKKFWSIIDWNCVLTTVQLDESILEDMMKAAENNKSFYGQNSNVAYITSGQILTEAFIERWFVNKRYDQDHIWANIFRKQLHISANFKAKYDNKQPKPVTWNMRRIVEQRIYDDKLLHSTPCE